MIRLISVLAVVLAACSSPYSTPKAAAHTDTSKPTPAVPTVTPAAPSASGYNIASGSKAPAAVAPVAVTQAPKIPLDLTRWISPDQRFYHDNVAAGQPITCNGRDSSGQALVAVTRKDGQYIDQGSSCLHVGQAVVDRWRFVYDSISKAHPSWSAKQIQDAITP